MESNVNSKTLTLNYGVATTASIFYNGKLPAAFLGWEETVDCYKLAVNRVEENFQKKEFRSGIDFDFFLWEGSYKWIKYDALYYDICWFYLIEVCKKSILKFSITKIEVEFDRTLVPKYFYDFIKNNCCVEVVFKTTKHKKSAYNFIEGLFIQLKQIAKGISFVVKNISPLQIVKSNKPIILFNLRNWKTHRYGSLIPFLEQDYAVVGLFPKFFINDKDWVKQENVINPYSYFSLLNLPLIFFKSLIIFFYQLIVFLKIRKIDQLFAQSWYQSFIQIFLVQIQSFSINAVLKRVKPKLFVSDGHYNGSYHRRVWFLCNRNNVKVLSITQKNILVGNIAYRINYKFDTSSLPNYFNVITKDSSVRLEEMGVPRKNIRIGYRGKFLNSSTISKSENIPIDLKLSDDKKVNIVLLLENDSWLNIRMVIWLLAVIPKESVNLLIRHHPSLPLNSQLELNKSLNGISFRDVSSISWEECIVKGNTLAFAINTTAVIEAFELGALIIWLNHLSDKSVPIYEIIDNIGLRYNTEVELIEKILFFVAEPKRINSELQRHKITHPFCDFEGSLNKEVDQILQEL